MKARARVLPAALLACAAFGATSASGQIPCEPPRQRSREACTLITALELAGAVGQAGRMIGCRRPGSAFRRCDVSGRDYQAVYEVVPGVDEATRRRADASLKEPVARAGEREGAAVEETLVSGIRCWNLDAAPGRTMLVGAPVSCTTRVVGGTVAVAVFPAGQRRVPVEWVRALASVAGARAVAAPRP